jgi:glycosyltransferase involved in cell wall biosynthesis
MKITIITPSFNQAQYLEATIQSVLSQKYPDLEYMIFDGGSMDNSKQIIEKYKNQLTYWESTKDKGQSDAINKGFAKTTGEIVTWLNSDDQLMPDALFEVAAYFEKNPDIAFVHGKTMLIKNTNDKTGIIKGAENKDLNYRYLAGLPFPQPSAFFRKKMLDLFGYLNESYHYGMDYDFFLKIILNYEGLKVEDVFSKYLLHKNSKTVSQSAVFARDYSKIFSRLLRSFPFTEDLIAQMKMLKMYEEGDNSYDTNKQFTFKDLQTAFCYHLQSLLTFYYEAGELKEAYALTSFLKKYYFEFYKSIPELARVHLRAKFLNRQTLSLLRKLLRS